MLTALPDDMIIDCSMLAISTIIGQGLWHTETNLATLLLRSI